MEEPEIIVGLDIGTTKIACIVGRRTEFGKVEVLGMGSSDSAGVTRGVVSNIEKTVNSISHAVKEAEESAGVEIGNVNVGIAGQHIHSIQHQGQRMRSSDNDTIQQDDINALVEDMHKLNMNPGEEIIHVIPQEYIVDGEEGITEPIGMSGNRLEANFHIIIGQVTAAKNIYKCVEQAGLQVDELILEPLASAEAALSEEEKEAGVALVDIGGGTTDIAIFKDNIIRHTAVIPFGGNVVSEDVKEGLTIIQKQAEQLKVKFGSALADESQVNQIVCIPGLRGKPPKEISVKNLSHIIQARMEEILGEVNYEIESSGYGDKLIGGIVLTGGGSQLSHMEQLCQYVTGMEARVGRPTEHLGKTQPEEVTSPMHATGVGLICKGFQTYQEQQRKERRIQTHSKKIKGSFFEKIFNAGRQWFDDEETK